MLKFHVFLGMFEALVFETENGDLDDENIPKNVLYKIRMDTGRVDSTIKFKVTDRSADCVKSSFIFIVISFMYVYLIEFGRVS